MPRLVGVSGGSGGGGAGFSSRTVCAISVPALLGLYLAYFTVALFLDASRLSHNAAVPSRDAGDEAISFWKSDEARAGRGEEFLVLNQEARLPNKGRNPGSTRITGDYGARSQHYGEIQSERQDWLIARAEELRSGTKRTNDPGGYGGLGGSRGKNLSSNDPKGAATKLGVDGDEAAAAGARPDDEGSTGVDGEDKAEADGMGERVDRDGGGGGENGRQRRRKLWRQTEESEAGGNEKLVTAAPLNSAGPDHPGIVEEVEAKTGGDQQRVANGDVVIVFPALAEAAASRERSAKRSAERNGSRAGGGFADERRLSAPGEGKLTMEPTLEERLRRLERGVELWGATYVPPMEPTRRQELVDKWSTNGGRKPSGRDDRPQRQEPVEEVQGRILYVISSFDRGNRLGRVFSKKVDKLDYVLMMFDEMREACEAGFRPQVHLIAAWDPSGVVGLAADRLFCKRMNGYVPFSYEEHPHSVGNGLSIKHRVYMTSRVEDFDVFLQVEDDMILTLNHIMQYQEESERLKYRRGLQNPTDELFIPGFIRIEPGAEGGGAEGIGEEWFEWEITLSRFRPVQLQGAGTYIGLDDSKVLKGGRNNQGLWMATRSQLEKLRKKCRYLDYFESTSTKGAHVESFSGSLEMFSSRCGFRKVFPATHFEDFLVHHRANNKNGMRGESIPAVPVSMLRVWADQFSRDESFLVEQKF